MREVVFVATNRGSVQQQLDELGELLAQSEANGWALTLLIDRAFDTRVDSGWADANSLYEGTRWDSLAGESPCLLELRPDDQPRLRRAVVRARGLPMLGLIATSCPIAELRAYWQALLAIRDPDGDELLLRWADTRCSAYLPSALEPENWQRLTAPLQAWWIVDRNGRVQKLPIAPAGDCTARFSAVPHAIELSQAEFSRLMAMAEPDAILGVVAEQMPEMLPEENLAEAHALANQACTLAKQHGVTGTPDLVALTVLALGDGVEALSREELPSLLEAAAAQPGSLADRLAALA